MREMGECVHSGILSDPQSTQSCKPDFFAHVPEAGWRSMSACICSGRGNGGKDDRWVRSNNQVLNGDWVMGGD